jgi:hypothetical protein
MITAHGFQEWIFAVLKIPEQCVQIIQIDGIKQHVYIKFEDHDRVQALLLNTAVQGE